MEDLISIITPSYNEGEYIETNLLSVENQEDTRIEHIVVDGGSTDGTVDILQEFSPDYTFRWVSEADEGQSHAINKGINMAEGDWIAWLNANDYYYRGAIKEFRKYLDWGADILYGDLYFVDENCNELFFQYNTLPSKLSEKFWTRFTANHCTLFHSTVFDAVGELNQELDYTMDAELFWRILTCEQDFSYFHFPKIVAAHRFHSDAKTFNQTIEEMNKIWSEKDQIYAGQNMLGPRSKKILSVIGVSAKTAWMVYEAFHPKYPLSIRRMMQGLSSDYRRALRGLFQQEPYN